MSVAHWRHRAGNDPFAAPGLSRETLQPPPQPPNEQPRFLASITAHQLDLQRRHRVREQPVCPPTRHHPPGALQALQLIRRKALDATETVSLVADCHHPAAGPFAGLDEPFCVATRAQGAQSSRSTTSQHRASASPRAPPRSNHKAPQPLPCETTRPAAAWPSALQVASGARCRHGSPGTRRHPALRAAASRAIRRDRRRSLPGRAHRLSL
jgi:hypothetical protein